MNQKLIEYITKNYKAKDGAKTSLWSEGNGDDQFYDGVAQGTASVLADIAEIIGMQVEPLAEQSFD